MKVFNVTGTRPVGTGNVKVVSTDVAVGAERLGARSAQIAQRQSGRIGGAVAETAAAAGADSGAPTGAGAGGGGGVGGSHAGTRCRRHEHGDDRCKCSDTSCRREVELARRPPVHFESLAARTRTNR